MFVKIILLKLGGQIFKNNIKIKVNIKNKDRIAIDIKLIQN